jgi:cell division protein FtsI/penicillin-binding protein 2
MPKSKISAFLYLLVVFLSGIMVGVFAYRLYMVNTVQSNVGPSTPAASGRRPDPEEVRRRIVADMRDKIGLDDRQARAVDLVLLQTRDDFNTVNHKIHDGEEQKIHDMLSPGQRTEYEKIHQQTKDEFDANFKRIHDDQVSKINDILRAAQRPLYEKYRTERDAEQQKRRQKK